MSNYHPPPPIRRYKHHRQNYLQRLINIVLTPFRILFEIALFLISTAVLLLCMCVFVMGTRPMHLSETQKLSVSYLDLVTERISRVQETEIMVTCGIEVSKGVANGLLKPIRPVTKRIVDAKADLYEKVRWYPDTYWQEVEKTSWDMLVTQMEVSEICPLPLPEFEKSSFDLED